MTHASSFASVIPVLKNRVEKHNSECVDAGDRLLIERPTEGANAWILRFQYGVPDITTVAKRSNRKERIATVDLMEDGDVRLSIFESTRAMTQSKIALHAVVIQADSDADAGKAVEKIIEFMLSKSVVAMTSAK